MTVFPACSLTSHTVFTPVVCDGTESRLKVLVESGSDLNLSFSSLCTVLFTCLHLISIKNGTTPVNRLRPSGHDNAGGASYDRFSSVFAHQSHRIHAGGMRRYGKPTESIS